METMCGMFDSGLLKKFDGSDFQIWKSRVKLILQAEELWDIVIGEEKPPCGVDASRCANQEVGDGVDTEGEHFAPPMSEEAVVFAKREAHAYFFILEGLKGTPATQVRTAKTAKEVWDRLLSVYESRKLWNRLSLRKKLYNVRMADGEPVREYISKVLSITQELVAVGAPASEHEKVYVLLNGLPDSFHVLVTCLKLREEETDFEFITQRLIEEEDMQSIRHSGDDPRQCGHEKKGNSLPSGTPAGRNRRRNARRCRFANRCAKNVGDRKEEDGSDQGDEYVLTAANPEHLESGDWLVATAATCHMTPGKDWFSSYNLLACPRNVIMLDNSVKKGIAVGDIRIVLPGGKKAVITKALHVPDLKMNLLSVGQMTEVGYSVAFGGGACTITMRNREVATGVRELGAYKLKGVMPADANSKG